MRSLPYLVQSARKRFLNRGTSCPSCGGRKARTVDRKFVVTSLRECYECCLLYRIPTTTEAENEKIYQSIYRQGWTTDLPTPSALKDLIEKNFVDSGMDFSRYIAVLDCLGIPDGSRMLDFGCSWGYGSYQLGKAGYQVDAYEISEDRAEYGKSNLGVHTVPIKDIEEATYDVFFSAHVIEHVPNVETMIADAMRWLKPGGLIVTFTPNGSKAFRAAKPDIFHRLWGFVHPQLIDDQFVQKRFKDQAYFVSSTPVDHAELKLWTDEQKTMNLTSDELFFVVRKSF